MSRRSRRIQRCARRRVELRYRAGVPLGSLGARDALAGVLRAPDVACGYVGLVWPMRSRLRVDAAQRYGLALACACDMCAPVIRDARLRSVWTRTLKRESTSAQRIGARARLGGGVVLGREARESDAAHALPDAMWCVLSIQRVGFRT